MKKNNKRVIKKGTVLAFASTGIILGIAYSPEPKQRPNKDFINKTYIRPNRIQRWYASEDRKKDIHQHISNIRKDIKIKAETYQIDRNTKITGITSTQKTAIHSIKLLNDIAKFKNIG